MLRYFLTVAQEESITRAAEVLHITQPTLSRQLAQLEEEMGVTLFERGSRKITLTGEGMLLRRRAEEIVELADKAAQELAKEETELAGNISIGCGELAAVETVAELCGMFREKYPQVSFQLYTATSDVIKERMEKGLIDVGVLLEPIDIAKYEFVRLNRPEEWCVLMRPDSPLAGKESLTREDLKDVPVLLPLRPEVRGQLANWFGRGFDKLHGAFTSNLATNSAVLASKGLGYALVIKGAASFWKESEIVSRPLYPPLTAATVLAWKRSQPFSRAAEKFISCIRQAHAIADSGRTG